MSNDSTRKYHAIRTKVDSDGCKFWFFCPLFYTKQQPCISSKCKLPLIHPEDVKCRYRPLYTIGLFLLKLFRRIFWPGPIGFAVVHAKGEEQKCDPSRKLVRACDLPLYVEEKCVQCSNVKPPEETFLTQTVKCMRKELWYLIDQTRIVKVEMEKCFKEIQESTEDSLKYLRAEENLLPRIGAIAAGGLTGYILALRKRFLKKLLYSTIGAATMAAIIYPEDAKVYSREGFKQIKKYIIVGYHFLNGVSRDLTGYQLPPLPNGHLVISDSAHPGPEAVPSSAHLLPPTATPTHIPLPHEDAHEKMKNHHHQIIEEK